MRRQISTRAVVRRGDYPVRWTEVVPQAVHKVLGIIVRDGRISVERADGRPSVALSTVAELWMENEGGETESVSVQITHLPQLDLGTASDQTEVSVQLVGQIKASNIQVTGEGLTIDMEAVVRLEVIAPVSLSIDAFSLEDELQPAALSLAAVESDSSASSPSDSSSSVSELGDVSGSGTGSDVYSVSDQAMQARVADASPAPHEPQRPKLLELPLKSGLTSVKVTRFHNSTTTDR